MNVIYLAFFYLHFTSQAIAPLRYETVHEFVDPLKKEGKTQANGINYTLGKSLVVVKMRFGFDCTTVFKSHYGLSGKMVG
ncbi:hypothetical protein [Dyadobacter sp. CY323]|uniref:hypothetical protein n=1 Tax=Dyadobacter sp. CY323 TaxID=2907302 RepID=UPI001F384E1B|nr:hypothetical protein [Dyadobacter sp. CY323]MCE6991808.1 hypothetical protein [Dyadobacter sp. CY323]